MLKNVLYAESIKLRRSPVWLAFIVLPVLSAIMGTFNYMQNREILTGEWYSLWSQHTLFTCSVFLPVLIGVFCSWLFRLEHLNHNWNTVMTAPLPLGYIYLGKLVIAGGFVLLTQLWIGVLFWLGGSVAGFQEPLPMGFFGWLAIGSLGGLVICALQLFFSMIIRSFAIPVGLALAGGISGLLMMAKGYGGIYPYSLLSIGMRANNPTEAMIIGMPQYLAVTLFYILLSIILSILWLKKRDTRSA